MAKARRAARQAALRTGMPIKESRPSYHAHVETPLGTVLLCTDAACLTGLYFVDQRDCPAPDGTPLPFKPSHGMHRGREIRLLRIRQEANLSLFEDKPAAAASRVRQGQLSSSRARNGVALGALKPLEKDMPAAALDLLRLARSELRDYFSGARREFTVPLRASGSSFQQAVWRALLDIPYGRYVSYGDIARQLGRPASHARAVGTAVGANPVSIIIPCHRVVSGAKAMTGYSGGLARKLALLEIEGMAIA
jgi:O-6-methylguanine DNA methyltransferase